MRRYGKWFALLLAVLMAAQLAPAALGLGVVEVPLSAKVVVSGDQPQSADTYIITLTALDGAPLPGGASGTEVSQTITGPGEVNFGSVQLILMGVYRYQITQSVKTPHPSAVRYDDTVYTAEIFVTNADVKPGVVITTEGGDKKDEAVFTNEYAETSVTATKAWQDGDNQDGKRDDVRFQLIGTYMGDDSRPRRAEVEDPIRIIPADAGGEALTVNWTGLPVFYRGNKEKMIDYTVTELGMDSRNIVIMKDGAEYEVTIEGDMDKGFTITNTHEPEEITVSVKKIWDDGADQDGLRPAELKVTLSDGVQDIETVTLDAGNEWSASREGLPKYRDGQEIVYTWTEHLPEELKDVYKLRGTTTEGTLTILTNEHSTHRTTASVVKVWKDEENQDGIRPHSLMVSLWDDGSKASDEPRKLKDVELNEGNKWIYTIEDLPKNRNGSNIKYTWREEYVPEGYTLGEPEVEGKITKLTNTHIPETISLTVEKLWVDGENAGNTRPAEVVITLSNGMDVALNQENNWKKTVEGLPKYRPEGIEIEYTWKENPIPGYTLTSQETREDGTEAFTNTIIQEYIEISGKKTWIDGGKEHDNAGEITLTLTRVSTKEGSKEETVDTAPVWDGDTYTYSELPKYDAEGYEYAYTVTEMQVEGYDEPVYDGTDITNPITQEYIEITGAKTWVDGGKEHDNAKEITLTLTRTANGKTGTVDAQPVWDGNTYKYSDLEKYDADGYEYTYTVTETKVSGYDTPVYDGYDITNPITQEYIKISGKKTWIDGGKEHDNAAEITLTLTRVSTKEGSKEETVDTAPVWDGDTYTYSELPKYDDEGYEYAYTVTETQVEGYDEPVYDGTDITNPITQEYIEITGAKTWVDGGKEHDNAKEITLTLTRTAHGKTETVDAQPEWDGDTYKFSDLEKYDADGYEYTYTVTETKVSGYDAPVYDGYDITNPITQEKISISGKKTWVDGGKTHDNTTEITLTLTRVSAKTGSEEETVDVLPVWSGNTYTYSDLDRYDPEGYEYTYTVTETQVEGYDAPEYSANDITNPITQEYIEITGAKTWVDGGRTHDNASEITLTLTRTAHGKTETVDAQPEWEGNTYKYGNLDKYDADGYEYTYAVTETKVSGYDAPVYDGYDITNPITQEKISISGKKTWVDGGKMHDNASEITLTLTRVSAKAGSAEETVGAVPEWSGNTYTYSDLDRYDAEGYEYTYTVTETQVAGYDQPVYDGTGITNPITQEYVDITGTKTWVDGGKEHDNAKEITLTLTRTANGKTETVTGVTPEWEGNTYKYSNLDKYDAGGYEYTYTVTEKQVSGYDAPSYDGYDITNPITQKKISISGTKTWVDGGKTHDNASEITLTLTRVSAKTGSSEETVGAVPVWSGNTYTYSGLDKYDAEGYEYTYTVTETQVAGYDEPIVSADGLSFTNPITQEYVDITGTKTWIDGGKDHDNAKEIRLTLTRTANGKTRMVDAAPVWEGDTYKYVHLDKYDVDGYEYTYTVTESKVKGYDAPVYAGYDITNPITQEKIRITGRKTWVDGGKTHDNASEITLTLTRVSAKAGSAEETVGATPVWSGNNYTYLDLDKYDAEGYEYTYTVTEDQVEGYDEPVYSGNNIRNPIHDPEDVEITGTKTWIDGGKTHDNAKEITLTLTRTANGKTRTVDATPVWEGNTYKYSGLDKYDEDGYEYTYTVTEKQVSGYGKPVYDENDITNPIAQEKIKITGKKTWVDGGKTHDNASEITLTLTRVSAKAGSEEETVGAAPVWSGSTYTYSGLDKYDAEGYEYTYTVTETQVEGYDEPVVSEDGRSFKNPIHDPEDVEITGKKTWLDGGKEHDNAKEITLTLTRTANGKTRTVDVTPVWEGDTYKYSNLDKYDEDGYEYTYTVTEKQVSGYGKPVYDENGITNPIAQEKIKITGKKTWVDGKKAHDNASEITLTLKRISAKAGSEEETVEAVPVWNGNTYTYSGLDKYDAEGYEYTYTVTETQVEGYDEPVVSEDGRSFTNPIHDPEDVEISGTKTWFDGGKTHDNAKEIKLTLRQKANGKTRTLDVQPVWEGDTYKFTNLEKYDDDGNEYTYTVSEAGIPGYESAQSGTDFTNTLLTRFTVIKKWADKAKPDERPGSITVYAYGGGMTYSAELSDANRWQTVFEVPMYDSNGREIEYMWTESSAPGYTMKVEISENVVTITNTITADYIDITGKKTWIDDGRAHDNASEITLTLTRVSTKPGSAEEIIDAVPVWTGDTYRFSDLLKYDEEGYEYRYTVTETKVDGYLCIRDGYNFINKLETEITVVKKWVDKNDPNARPLKITIYAAGNGESYSLELSDSNNWTGTINVPKFDKDGNEIVYVWTESSTPGYTMKVEIKNNVVTITNTRKPDPGPGPSRTPTPSPTPEDAPAVPLGIGPIYINVGDCLE